MQVKAKAWQFNGSAAISISDLQIKQKALRFYSYDKSMKLMLSVAAYQLACCVNSVSLSVYGSLKQLMGEKKRKSAVKKSTIVQDNTFV